MSQPRNPGVRRARMHRAQTLPAAALCRPRGGRTAGAQHATRMRDEGGGGSRARAAEGSGRGQRLFEWGQRSR
eukprot:2734127-Prymnesium_polylepis.1